MKTMYIAGKISGLPYHRTYLKFLLREIMIWFWGYKPVNPMREISKDWNYEDQVRYGCILAIWSDCIYLSHNWRRSHGAYRELRSYLRSGQKEIVYFKMPKHIIKLFK